MATAQAIRKRIISELKEDYNYHIDTYHRNGGKGISAKAIDHYLSAREAKRELEEMYGEEV